MATTSSPYGLRPVNLVGSQPYTGATRLYKMPSAYALSIQYGDPVIITNTGTDRGQVARFAAVAATTTTSTTTIGLLGVFVGCTYTDPVMGKVFRQNYPGNITASDLQAYVVDDPDALFQVQADGVIAQTRIGCNAALIQTVAGTGVGNAVSGVGLSASSVAATAALPVRIVSFVDAPGSAAGDAFTDVLVRINAHMHRTGATGFAGVAAT